MVVALLVVGAGLVLAGLAAIGFGIPYKEFSVGSTLIVTGVTGVCTGTIVLAIAVTVRELQNIARRLGPGMAAGLRPEFPLPPPAAAPSPRNPPPAGSGFPFQRDHSPAEASPVASPPSWFEEASQRGAHGEPVPPSSSAEAPSEESTPFKRRNLLFSSTSRKERERTRTRAAEPVKPDLLSPELRLDTPAPAESQPGGFEDAWPKPERSRSVDVAPRRSARAPSTFSDTDSGAPSPIHSPPSQEHPPVTVLKSGVVDGMAYSLYSDGSIEAQMPEGMMRFASIDELRSHLEQRP
ncbi:DUF308 domain-containing protein [Bradyrhizobium lablabi]|uniref:DUF308 domain-containing protein n=1 Tax=Bradyrhizobium lablabi TaxID=722472 RepID=UPI001BA91C8F|nr:DUF308 domain-containing protein [Bradyrhizobium lablabi]MBR0694688.1 DUF308 domain-containing protein [Bradyrhizobium lablabi]